MGQSINRAIVLSPDPGYLWDGTRVKFKPCSGCLGYHLVICCIAMENHHAINR